MLLTNLFPLQYKVSNTMNRPTNKFNRSVSTSHVQKINDVESPQPKKERNASIIPIIRPSSSVKQRKFKLPTLPGNWKQYFRSNTASTTSTGELSKEEDCIPSPKKSVSKSPPQPKYEDVSKGPSWKLSERRLQTRRTRNSLFKSLVCQTDAESLGYLQLRQDERLGKDDAHDLIVAAMISSLEKKHLCDAELLGVDGISVNAPSFLLCMFSSVIEEMLFPNALPLIEESKGEDITELNSFAATTSPLKVDMPFATAPAISAMLRFLAAQTLPDDVDDIRVICQVYVIGKLFKINALTDEAHRKGRLLINKSSGSEFVCAAFDECKAIERAGDDSKWWGHSFSGINDMKSYALDCILDAPAKILLREGGVKFLSPDSIQEVLSNHDLDSDEETVFLILKNWVDSFQGDYEKKIEAANILVGNIDFSLIPPDSLRKNVAACDFVDEKDVNDALRAIELRHSNRSPEDFEHVRVEGAGIRHVNGIYVRLEEDIGMDADDIVFVKEATYEDGDFSDFGLYLHQNTWSIASCADYSNIFYSCKADGNISNREETPLTGWKTGTGTEPAPLCHWNACKDGAKVIGYSNGDAPNLEDFHEETRLYKKVSAGSAKSLDRSDYSDQQSRRITLWKMLNLPEDQSFRNSIRFSIKD